MQLGPGNVLSECSNTASSLCILNEHYKLWRPDMRNLEAHRQHTDREWLSPKPYLPL